MIDWGSSVVGTMGLWGRGLGPPSYIVGRPCVLHSCSVFLCIIIHAVKQRYNFLYKYLPSLSNKKCVGNCF